MTGHSLECQSAVLLSSQSGTLGTFTFLSPDNGYSGATKKAFELSTLQVPDKINQMRLATFYVSATTSLSLNKI